MIYAPNYESNIAMTLNSRLAARLYVKNLNSRNARRPAGIS